MFVVAGRVGTHDIELEVLSASGATAGSWYFGEPAAPPRRWLGRCFAGRS